MLTYIGVVMIEMWIKMIFKEKSNINNVLFIKNNLYNYYHQ